MVEPSTPFNLSQNALPFNAKPMTVSLMKSARHVSGSGRSTIRAGFHGHAMPQLAHGQAADCGLQYLHASEHDRHVQRSRPAGRRNGAVATLDTRLAERFTAPHMFAIISRMLMPDMMRGMAAPRQKISGHKRP